VRTASRKHADEGACGSASKFGDERGVGGARGHVVGHGVAREPGREPGRSEMSGFERENRQEFVIDPGDSARTPRAPGPHLRRDVADRPDPHLLRRRRQPHVEAGVVDEHGQPGSAFPEQPQGSSVNPYQLWGCGNHGEDPHDGLGGEIFVQLEPGLGHFRPAESESVEVGTTGFETPEYGRGMEIPRRFSGEHRNLETCHAVKVSTRFGLVARKGRT
jgi:hypothetical protein